jgi:hypothetical protein
MELTVLDLMFRHENLSSRSQFDASGVDQKAAAG